MSLPSKVLHLSHVGPSKIPSGGRVLTDANVRLERELGLESHWISIRPEGIAGEKRTKNHLRNLEGNHSSDLPSIYWDHKMSYMLANSMKAQSFLRSWIQADRHMIFVLEGPWLWPLLRIVLKSYKNLKYDVVYAAHNVEFDLAHKIGITDGSDPKLNEISRALLLSDESDLVKRATAVTYLSHHDGELLRALGAKEMVRTYVPSPSLQSRRFSFIDVSKPLLNKEFKWFTFVSGDWAPHVNGVAELLGSMRRGNENKIGIVIAGGVAAGLERISVENKLPNLKSRNDVLILGQISNNVLQKLAEESTGFVLPIDFGGGMGIKTIEALQSFKPVFGTRSAFRGLEEIDLGRQVTISESSAELWSLLQLWKDHEYEINKDLIVFNNRDLIWPSVSYLLSLAKRVQS